MTKITECNTTEQEELFEVAVDINDSLLDLLPGDLPEFANVPKHAVPHEVSPPVSVGQMDDDVVADGNTTDKSTNKHKKRTLRRLEISQINVGSKFPKNIKQQFKRRVKSQVCFV